MKKNVSILGFLEYIIVFLSISVSATMWVQPEINIINKTLGVVVLMGLVMVWSILCNQQIKKEHIKWLIFISLCIMLCILFHISYVKKTLFTLVPILVFCYFGFVSYSSQRLNNIYNAFVNTMCLIAVVSLLFIIIIRVFGVPSPNGYYSLRWSWMEKVPSYFNLYYDPMPNGFSIGGFTFPRNCGIYPEAPMFMYPLVLALMINKLVLQKSNSKKNKLLIITIITTVSITGYIIVVTMYVCQYLFITDVKRSIYIKLCLPIIAVIGILVVYFFYASKMDTYSGSVRTDHLHASVLAFIKTYGLGCGIGNAEYVENLMQYNHGISVGLPYILATGGVFWCSIFMVPLIRAISNSIQCNQKNRVLFSLLFFLLLFMTSCQSNMHTWLVFGTTILTWINPLENRNSLKIDT